MHTIDSIRRNCIAIGSVLSLKDDVQRKRIADIQRAAEAPDWMNTIVGTAGELDKFAADFPETMAKAGL